jgi:hypothetical protein
LDNAEGVSSKSTERFSDRSSSNDHQVCLLLSGLFADALDDIAHCDPKGSVNARRAQH